MTDPSQPSSRPVVWVFGAGITGLSAAHELSARGYEVHVVEPAHDPLAPSLPAVGGVARSQWASLPREPGADGAIARTTALTTPGDEGARVPGEHGFRYFPGFYRHLFDTMRRIPLEGDAARTVFDRLVPTRAMWMVVARESADAPAVVRFSRERPTSLAEVFAQHRAMLEDVGYTSADVARLTLKLFQYMTTSPARRAAEFEDATWWDFIEGARFSPRCREHLERGPEVLGAMAASESDARTQGNCVVQLLMDQLVGRALTDATLDGPTSSAWFDPWRAHLTAQGVAFHRGRLTGFAAPPRDGAVWREGVVLPRVEVDGRELSPETFATARRPHAFVLALPATAMMGLPEFLAQGQIGAPADGLAARFLAVHKGVCDEGRIAPDDTVDDFVRVAEWAQSIERARDEAIERRAETLRAQGVHDADAQARRAQSALGAGPLRHLTGVQYFFPTAVQTGQEHMLYMDSPWRLSSISQLPFWRGRAVAGGRVRGLVSVDLGALHRPDGDGVMAWDCGPDEIARRVWLQVRGAASVESVAAGAPPPEAVAYHLDHHIVFGDAGVERNLAPYLINAPSEWARRPGSLHDGAARSRGYDAQNGHWVLAGVYAKTFTRLTTMEAANESARHAVNAILRAHGASGDRCAIWNPEEHEIDDLAPLRALDAKLFRDGYPHMAEILELDAVPAWLWPRARAESAAGAAQQTPSEPGVRGA